MHLVRWLSRFLFFAFGLCLLSCSSPSIIFLHNDTSAPLEYKISAQIDPRMGRESNSGVFGSNEVVETLPHFSSGISKIVLEVRQNGEVRTQIFTGGGLPKGNHQGHNGHIKVSKSSFIGEGSGNWYPDTVCNFGFFLCPCVGLSIIGFIIFRSKHRRKSKPSEQIQG